MNDKAKTCGSDSSTEFDTADVVFHKPTKEHWLVAYVKGDRMAWCGWPEGEAKTEDCTLRKKATTEQRLELLQSMARSSGPRGEYAKHRLSELSNAGSNGPSGVAAKVRVD